MKCPTKNCPEILLVHSRRMYCYKCRAAMRYHSDKRPAEILEYSNNLNKRIYRIEHLSERRLDQQEALSQMRRNKRTKK
jgi:uncharacterized protein YdcH (DUF465 family)